MMTDPAAHGSQASDSFDVLVPNLPGYGFAARLAAVSFIRCASNIA